MDDELLNKLLDEVVYEKDFYEAVAETPDYDVVSLDATATILETGKEELYRKALELQCERLGLKVLYRLSYGTYAVVFAKNGEGKIGIIPETNPDGWEC